MMQWLTRNWTAKLVSLILAVGLWLFAVGEEGVEVQRTIPLVIQVKNPQMSILETSTHSLQIVLSAPRALLSDMASKEIQAVHEIGGEVKNAGEYSFRVEPGEIELPSAQIRVVKIEPGVIQVTLDEVITKKLRIEPRFFGDPAFGYKVNQEEMQLDPNAVLIEGPKGQLEKQESVKTEKIDLVGRIRSFRRTVGLELPPNVRPISETLIDVYVPIREEFEEKHFENVPVKVLRALEVDGRVFVEPATLSFVLKGPKRQLENMAPEGIMVYVDASFLSFGEHEAAVQMVLPESVSLKEETPVTVKLKISKS